MAVLHPALVVANTQRAQGPTLASVSAFVSDLDSGETVFAKHPEVILPIASITKLMTAMVVLDSKAALDAWVPMQPWRSALSKNAYSRIRIPSEARRADLLRIALMSSENRAAYNLGENYSANSTTGVDDFVIAMNAKAADLGMVDTQFVDPMGLAPDNRSTARDLSLMLAAAYDYDLIREYSTDRQHTVRFRKPSYKLGYGNTNPLTGSSRWDVALSKTGYLTEAGRCMVMVTEADGKTLAMVFLNSFGKRSPLGDAGRIRRWLETGTVSRVATAARDHERMVSKSLGLD